MAEARVAEEPCEKVVAGWTDGRMADSYCIVFLFCFTVSLEGYSPPPSAPNSHTPPSLCLEHRALLCAAVRCLCLCFAPSPSERLQPKQPVTTTLLK